MSGVMYMTFVAAFSSLTMALSLIRFKAVHFVQISRLNQCLFAVSDTICHLLKRTRIGFLNTAHDERVVGDPYDLCAICLDDFEEGEKLRLLPCNHGNCQLDPYLVNCLFRCFAEKASVLAVSPNPFRLCTNNFQVSWY